MLSGTDGGGCCEVGACVMTWCVNGGTIWGEICSVMDAGRGFSNDQFLSSSRLIQAASFTSDFFNRPSLLPNVLMVLTALVISADSFDEPEFKYKNFTSSFATDLCSLNPLSWTSLIQSRH